MLIDLYVFGDSIVHRMRPRTKIIALVVMCTLLFLLEGWPMLAAAGLVVAGGFALADLKPGHAWRALRPAFWILAAIFAVQAVLTDIVFAGFVVTRFAVLILAASLVTLTTRTSEFVEGIHAALTVAPGWVPADKIALAMALCLRFIPMVRSVLDEVRMAQRARGLERNLVALLVPLIVRTLKNADEIAEAIQVRSPD